ncbi:hypothetical protein EGJ50_10635 [Pseudomonas luteola]|nr:hypothetical protein FOB45_25435 [Pseudomonas luteola]RRW47476.1 hypothetical protein EGJ50_10635 [Pseudomonas luteola]
MNNERTISILNNGKLESAKIIYCLNNPSRIELFLSDGNKFSSLGNNLFESFSNMRRSLKYIIFLCKGAKINVYPSRMSSQMSSGLMAYEVKMGRPALRENLVNIFDYEDERICINPDDQKNYFEKWLMSI